MSVHSLQLFCLELPPLVMDRPIFPTPRHNSCAKMNTKRPSWTRVCASEISLRVCRPDMF